MPRCLPLWTTAQQAAGPSVSIPVRSSNTFHPEQRTIWGSRRRISTWETSCAPSAGAANTRNMACYAHTGFFWNLRTVVHSGAFRAAPGCRYRRRSRFRRNRRLGSIRARHPLPTCVGFLLPQSFFRQGCRIANPCSCDVQFNGWQSQSLFDLLEINRLGYLSFRGDEDTLGWWFETPRSLERSRLGRDHLAIFVTRHG